MILKIVILALACFTGGFSSDAKTEDKTGTKIVGGTLAPLGSIRHQVSVQSTDVNRGHICGGSLVSLRHVVTAAHCFLNANNILVTTPSLYQVNGGQVALTSSSWQIRRAFNVTVHPSFNRNTFLADIAAIVLASAFSQTTALAPLGWTFQPLAVGTLCQVSGWGVVQETSIFIENLLRVASVPIVNQVTCGQAYNFTTNQNILYDMVCAGYPNGGVDSCQGDSGGPFTCNGVLTGVVSWGSGCARGGYYGVYTRVESYSAWINRVVNGSSSVQGSLLYSTLLSIILYFVNFV